jgi:hypothetical protein
MHAKLSMKVGSAVDRPERLDFKGVGAKPDHPKE